MNLIPSWHLVIPVHMGNASFLNIVALAAKLRCKEVESLLICGWQSSFEGWTDILIAATAL